MIVFQVPLNFDPVKEILKIMSGLYLNEEKDYSEENKVAMKAFTPPFFNHFSLSLKRKKMCDNESHEKDDRSSHS